MTQATNQITSKFKLTYLNLITPEAFAKAQELGFQMGFQWTMGGREIKEFGHDNYLYIDIDNRLWWSDNSTGPFFPPGPQDGWREITLTELAAGAQEVKAIKRRESKESKKRRAQRKWDATARKNCFIGRPVRKDGIVSVKFASGEVYTAAEGAWNWSNDIGGATIVSYKVHKRNEHKPKRIEGEWIDWSGGQCPVKAEDWVKVKFRGGFGSQIAQQNNDRCYWDHRGSGGDIVAYYIEPESERAPKTVTQEEMVKALADSIGKPLAIPVESSADILDAANNVIGYTSVTEVDAPDTNPKRQYGVSSVPLNMWSPLASAYGALGLYNGSLKYGKANFANTPVEASIYIAAAMRHLNAWAAGEEFDPADGVPNLGGVLANIAILLEARAAGTLIDDRLKMSGYLKERDALKEIVKSLNELHAGKTPKHYTLGAE